MHARIIVDPEILDPKRRHRVDQPHHAVLFTGIRKAAQVIDPARAGLPMRHRRPFRFVPGQRRLDDLACHGFAMRHIDDRHRSRFRIQRIGRQFLGCGRLHANRQAVDA